MEKEITLPQISEGEDTGLVSDIYVKEGDHVESEQSIIAVESDKATVDVPVEEEGNVKSIRVKEGDEIKAGDIILILDTKEKQDGSPAGKKGKKEEKEEEEKTRASNDMNENGGQKTTDGKQKKELSDVKEEQPEKEGAAKEETRRLEKTKSEETDKEIPAAPLARKFARELGIDLQKLNHGDPEQRVTREDVFNYAKKVITGKNQRKGERKTNRQIDLPDFSQWGETEKKPLSAIRRITAVSTQSSWRNIPHVTNFDEADITAFEKFRKRQKGDVKLTVTSMLLKLCGEALKKFPEFNASLDMQNQEIIYKKYYHIGVAVDTKDGLLVPVIRDVDKKSMFDLAEELAEVSEKALNRKLTSDEMKGGNFVISNLGGIGGTSFTPIIYPPQAAILGVSRADVKPLYIRRKAKPRKMLPLSLSYDHRLIDGADAARFLRWLSKAMENPWNLL